MSTASRMQDEEYGIQDTYLGFLPLAFVARIAGDVSCASSSSRVLIGLHSAQRKCTKCRGGGLTSFDVDGDHGPLSGSY